MMWFKFNGVRENEILSVPVTNLTTHETIVDRQIDLTEHHDFSTNYSFDDAETYFLPNRDLFGSVRELEELIEDPYYTPEGSIAKTLGLKPCGRYTRLLFPEYDTELENEMSSHCIRCGKRLMPWEAEEDYFVCEHCRDDMETTLKYGERFPWNEQEYQSVPAHLLNDDREIFDMK